MNGCMKTITLDEEAYQRLRGWKRARGDSFSKVVKRVVPEAGTLGAMARFVGARVETAGEAEKDAILEETITDRPVGKPDPWT